MNYCGCISSQMAKYCESVLGVRILDWVEFYLAQNILRKQCCITLDRFMSG